jgi:hypothetical protein
MIPGSALPLLFALMGGMKMAMPVDGLFEKLDQMRHTEGEAA